MELWTPDQIALNETSNALMKDVEETARRVNEDRPLPPEVVARINDELLGERVYNSNAIEGSTLDLRETIMVLKHGVGGAQKKREAKEAANLGKAIKELTRYLDDEQPVHDLQRFLDIHQMILAEVNDQWAGRLREHGVMIRGARHQPPDHSLVPALVERVMESLRGPRNTSSIVDTAWAHWAIARIHPFYDRNGRIARLWQDIILFQGQLTCAVIRPEDRRNYLDTLMEADDGNFNPLIQLVAQRVAATFDKYVIELGKDEWYRQRVSEIAGEVDARAAEGRKLSYQRWSRKMEQVRREFELCAVRVSEVSKTVKIQVQFYPLIDQSQWENILSGLGAKQTWWFTLSFSTQRKRLKYYFFFGKHFWTDCDNQLERAEQRVSLLISEDDPTGRGVQLDDMGACPITTREIFVVDDSFVCRRFDPVTEQTDYQRNVDGPRIALDFIHEVVLHRLR